MKKLFQSNQIQVAAASLLLASCAATVDPQYAITEDEFETMRTSQFDHAADGAMRGAAIGALTGAGLAALQGGDGKAIATGAAAGGIAGGLVGGTMGFQKGDEAGKQLVNKKRLTKEQQKIVSNMTKEAKQKEAQASVWISKLRNGIAAGAYSDSQAKKYADEIVKSIYDRTETYKGSPYYDAQQSAEFRGSVERLQDQAKVAKDLASEAEKRKIGT